MQHLRSQKEKAARRRVGRHAILGATLACACATGVDVTEEELAEICSDPATDCEGAGAVGGSAGAGSPNGGLGGSTPAPIGPSTGGSFNAGQGGRTGLGGSNTGAGGSTNNGAGGTGNQPQPLAMGTCLASDQVLITYEDRSAGAAMDNEPSMRLGVENTGAAFNLSALTIRYWFTADGASGFTGNIDYSSVAGGSASVSVSFGEELGANYAELSFSGTDMVGPEGVDEVQLRFHGNPYQDMSQTNDFSFIASAPNGTSNRNITPYVSGVQVGGCEPLP
jgi:hypothetical protein